MSQEQTLRTGMVRAFVAAVCAMGPAGSAVRAADCSVTSVGFLPINDLGTGFHLGQFQGGLYPDGLNEVPSAHAVEGLARAESIVSLDTEGSPVSNGKVVLMSIGMSNTAAEFLTFINLAGEDVRVDDSALAIVNGAAPGQTAVDWDSPEDDNYDRVRDDVLAPQGLTEAQVQVIWIKQANPSPSRSLPDVDADAYRLLGGLGDVARAVKQRYPNCRIIFCSSRIYAGYATGGLNPEPFAYEGGFSVKWLIEAQINQVAGGGIDPIAGDLAWDSAAPWIAWGPYLWADGLDPRSDGLTWACSELATDGTHPSETGRLKVAGLLLDFLVDSPFAQPWFLASSSEPGTGDCDEDGDIDLDDFAGFATCLTDPGGASGPGCTCVDFEFDGDVDLLDFSKFQRLFAGTPVPPDPASDDFERAELGNGWLVIAGAPGIINSSDLGVAGGSVAAVAWQASTFSADQFCEVATSGDWDPADSLQIRVRVDTQTGNGYGFRGGGSGQYTLRGPGGTLASGSGPAMAPGDVMRIEVEGDAIRGLVNGNVILSASDTALSSGAPGITMGTQSGAPAPMIESWTGGSL